MALPILTVQQRRGSLLSALLSCCIPHRDSYVQCRDSFWPMLQKAAKLKICVNQSAPLGLQLRTADSLLPEQPLLRRSDGMVSQLPFHVIYHTAPLGQAELYWRCFAR